MSFWRYWGKADPTYAGFPKWQMNRVLFRRGGVGRGVPRMRGDEPHQPGAAGETPWAGAPPSTPHHRSSWLLSNRHAGQGDWRAPHPDSRFAALPQVLRHSRAKRPYEGRELLFTKSNRSGLSGSIYLGAFTCLYFIRSNTPIDGRLR